MQKLSNKQINKELRKHMYLYYRLVPEEEEKMGINLEKLFLD